jgi:prolyl-tRNA synthetase
VESASALYEEQSLPEPIEPFAKVATPTQKTIAEISEFLNVPAQRILKTIAVVAMQRDDQGAVIKETFYDLFLRGDHELNEIKTRKIIGEFRFATDEEIIAHHGCIAGFLGPKLDAKHPCLFDHAVKYLSDFVCGANEAGFHLRGCHWAADSHTKAFYEQALADNAFHDLRNVVAGDKSPDGKGEITLARGIEVGHIFQLGTKYSASMKAGIINEAGKNQIMIMGCYGIGISRVVAAAIEQNHDARGIIWPAKLAPFQVALLPMNLHKSERLKVATEKLYADLIAAGIDVLLDDRKVRAGFMFSDMELIGIPHSIIISDRGLDEGTLEYKARTASDNEIIPSAGVIEFLKAKLI